MKDERGQGCQAAIQTETSLMYSYSSEKEKREQAARLKAMNISQKLLLDTQCELEIGNANFGLWPVRQTSPDDSLFETLQKMSKQHKHRSSDAGRSPPANRITGRFEEYQSLIHDTNIPREKASKSFVAPPSRIVVGDR